MGRRFKMTMIPRINIGNRLNSQKIKNIKHKHIFNRAALINKMHEAIRTEKTEKEVG